jgi:hydrogenase maturation protease
VSRVCILGVGSPSGDDQAGWLTVDALLDLGIRSGDGIVIEKLDRPGSALIPLLGRTAWLILVDAMQGEGETGEIRRFDQTDWPHYGHGLSSHGLGVIDALMLAGELGSLPPSLDLYGIEVGGTTPASSPSRAIRAAAARLANMIADRLGSGFSTPPGTQPGY